jgi:purine-binding chemotaxis protein CheW
VHSMGSLGYTEPLLATTDSGETSRAAETWVLFLVDKQVYALQIWEVERIVRAVEVKPLPESPPHIRGVVNMHGRVLPVVDLRARFGQPPRDIHLDDHFIVARTSDFSVVLPVDAALGSLEISGGTAPRDDVERARCLRKVMTLDTEMVYALDLQQVVFAGDSPTDSDLASVLAELRSA